MAALRPGLRAPQAPAAPVAGDPGPAATATVPPDDADDESVREDLLEDLGELEEGDEYGSDTDGDEEADEAGGAAEEGKGVGGARREATHTAFGAWAYDDPDSTLMYFDPSEDSIAEHFAFNGLVGDYDHISDKLSRVLGEAKLIEAQLPAQILDRFFTPSILPGT